MASGSLTIIGTGYLAAGHLTAESLGYAETAEKLFLLVGDPVTKLWLQSLNSTAEDLHDCYAAGKPRLQSYQEMVECMLAPVRSGQNVVVAFYGHPGVFVYPSHEAIRIARKEGFPARMLPAISAEDCLFADLGIDPAAHGCHSFEATDFLIRKRVFDPRSHLILWQIGAVGVVTYENTSLWSRSGLEILMEELLKYYPGHHEVTIYEASVLPICEPKMERISLEQLSEASVSVVSTLYVPPREKAEPDPEMLQRLNLTLPESGGRPQ